MARRDEIELSWSMTVDADWAGADCMYAIPAATAPAAMAAVPTAFMDEVCQGERGRHNHGESSNVERARRGRREGPHLAGGGVRRPAKDRGGTADDGGNLGEHDCRLQGGNARGRGEGEGKRIPATENVSVTRILVAGRGKREGRGEEGTLRGGNPQKLPIGVP